MRRLALSPRLASYKPEVQPLNGLLALLHAEETDLDDDGDEDEFVGALLDELSTLRTAVRPSLPRVFFRVQP